MNDNHKKITELNIQTFMEEVVAATGVSRAFIEQTRPALERIFFDLPTQQQGALLESFREAAFERSGDQAGEVRDALESFRLLYEHNSPAAVQRRALSRRIQEARSPEERAILMGFGGLGERQIIEA